MATLLIDNYDSYTYNLFQLLAAVEGREPVVVRNDEVEWSRLRAERFDRCVISPGPGRADRARDFGLSGAALAQAELPVLGVCLGHQGLALAHGGSVDRAGTPMHGRRSRIYHDGSELFDGIPQGFLAVRYHSLAVTEPLPDALEVLARSGSGTVMAIRHRTRPHWGVQFHPESVGTQFGAVLVGNFVAHCAVLAGNSVARSAPTRVVSARPRRMRGRATSGSARPIEVRMKTVARPVDAESAFVGLFGEERNAFWLDSARPDGGQARFSFMGAGDALITHEVGSGERLLDRLERRLAAIEVADGELPFNFTGGLVGYLGYELKAECGAALAHRSPLPDAQLLDVDRLVVYDHLSGAAHVVWRTDSATDWAEHTARRLRLLKAAGAPAPSAPGGWTAFSLARPAPRYLDDIERCQRYLAAGESYEICLTNELRGPRCPDALALYRVLRRLNPAPFGAFLRLGGVEVLSSSPERFLALDRSGVVEAKPIKGTAPRGATPEADAAAAAALRAGPKDRAENLMIVDVLRNDLGRVAEAGSVHVPTLMGVESYETVHQLVSTVRARLRGGATIVDGLRAAFPGGSMTGAPKLRTMEIIDRLEARPRGPYAGAIGYLASNGTADLSIAIRTIVNSGHGLTIGAGGAITVQSDPHAELDELLLKARAPLEAVGVALHGRADAALIAPARRSRRSAMSGVV